MTQTETGARAGCPSCTVAALTAGNEVRVFLLCDRFGTQGKEECRLGADRDQY